MNLDLSLTSSSGDSRGLAYGRGMATGLPEGSTASEDAERQRFQTELEFVQCLSNPHYLNFLAQQGYLKEPEFVNYLQYLHYWKKQEYAKYLKYPQCLHFLDLLQSEIFRRELAYAQCTKFIEEQQLQHWHLYTKKRSQFQQKILSKGKPAPVDK